MFYDVVKSPLGLISITASNNGVTGITVSTKQDQELKANKHTDAMKQWLERYFDGKNPPHNVELDVAGGPFYSKVWSCLQDVPTGVTVSYIDLAKKAGSPRAMRAVGTAMATNRVPLYIPCHRVVKSDGKIGNYGPGPSKKQWLLEFEGAM